MSLFEQYHEYFENPNASPPPASHDSLPPSVVDIQKQILSEQPDLKLKAEEVEMIVMRTL